MAVLKDIMKFFPYSTPRQSQVDVLRAVEQHWDNFDILVIVAPTACHGKGERVLMYDGTAKAIEDVQVGDLLIGPDSKPRQVLHTTNGVSELFLVKETRASGASYVMTGNHLLPVKKYTASGGHGKPKKWRIEHTLVQVDKWNDLSKTAKHCIKLWKPDNIQFKPQETPFLLTPYELGAWLGDGTASGPSITTMDIEVKQMWESLGERYGLGTRIEQKPNNKACTIYLTAGMKNRTNPITSVLRDLDLLNNKHIPPIYLCGSYGERMELLAGLMDTDGNFNPKLFSAEITQKRPALIEDIERLVISLGFNSSRDIKTVNGVSYYRVTFSGRHLSTIPLRIQRKRIATDTKRDMKNTGFSVTPIGVGEYYGVTVDSDNLYLLHNGCVTHNCGKTAMIKTISAWSGNASIITPTNVLVEQMAGEFETGPEHSWADGPPIHKLMKREWYRCSRFANGKISCAEAKAKYGKKLGCSKECAYVRDNSRARGRGVGIYNYYTYMAHKLFRPVLCADEAHNCLKTIQDLSSVKIWKHDFNFPWDMWSYADIIRWLEAYEAGDMQTKGGGELPELLQALKSEVTTTAPRYVIKRDREMWNMTNPPEERALMRMLPIDVRDAMPFLWPSKVKKIVLLSATISRIDIEMMGLDKRRVLYLEADSPIPAERRPIYRDYVGTVNRGNMEEMTRKMAERIVSHYLPMYEGQKGFIHATYSQAKMLRSLLPNEDGRFIFHDKTDTARRLDEFKASDPALGKVMIASGLYEGVDLADDLGRWQLICKIPYPSLGDPAIKHKANQSPEWYCWETLKSACQAAGRICRNETDLGTTYILDGSFDRLYTQAKRFELLPKWFDNAIFG